MSGHKATLRAPSVHINYTLQRDPGNSNKVAGNVERNGTNSSCQRSKAPLLTGRRRGALSLAVMAASLPGRTMPQSESEGDEELGGLGLRDVIVRTQWQPGPRTDTAHAQGSQRLCPQGLGPWVSKRPVHARLLLTRPFTSPAGRLHRSGCSVGRRAGWFPRCVG